MGKILVFETNSDNIVPPIPDHPRPEIKTFINDSFLLFNLKSSKFGLLSKI